MKKGVLLMLILLLTNIGYSQTYNLRSHATKKIQLVKKATKQSKTCEVSGVVRYFFNDYIGYRPDLGATIQFIKKKDMDGEFDFTKYLEYSSYKSYAISYYTICRKYGENAALEFTSKFGFKKADLEKFKTLCDSLSIAYFELAMITDKTSSRYCYETLVDASSSYRIRVPYGEYYVIIKSKNRKGVFKPEILGRFEIEDVKLDKPSYILSQDFDKE